MTNSRCAILAALGLTIVGSACTQKPAAETTSATSAAVDNTKAATGTALDATKKGVDKALDATKVGTDKALDATRKGMATAIDGTQRAGEASADAARSAADQAAHTTRKIAGEIATKTKDFTSTTGEVMTDAWITTKVKAKFADETLLRGSDMNVATDDHVVTLKGTVSTPAAKNRAAVIARGSEGVTHVVNQLVVK
jgi:osmotically-inducible protein OsmY